MKKILKIILFSNYQQYQRYEFKYTIELFIFTFLLIISHEVNKYTFDLKGVFAKN